MKAIGKNYLGEKTQTFRVEIAEREGQGRVEEIDQHCFDREEELLGDDTSSRASSQFFNLKVKPSKNMVYQVKGSWRICTSFITFVFGLISIYLINVSIDTNCFQQFRQLYCSVASRRPQCIQLLHCIESKETYYFTIEENVILLIGVALTAISVSSWHKNTPPRISFKSSKEYQEKNH